MYGPPVLDRINKTSMYIHAGDIFVIIGYYFKTIYLTVPEMTGPKVCWAASCKKLFWAVYLVCYLLCFLCVYLSTVTHTRKCLHAAEVISGLTKVKGEGGDLIQNESQFNRVRKKDNNKKSICHQHSVYHVRKRKYQLSTPPTFFCAISAGWNRSWMLIDPFYFRLLLKQKCPWNRLQGVHRPGPDKWSMDPITGGPWTWSR